MHSDTHAHALVGVCKHARTHTHTHMQAWGWVQEMYGFAIGLWKAGIKRVDLHLQLMAQVRASAD